MKRVNTYDIHNNPPQTTWDTLANEIDALEDDLYIVQNNGWTLGAIPKDIKKRLRRLVGAIKYCEL